MVEEEVTFCNRSEIFGQTSRGAADTHDRRNGIVVVLAMLHQRKDIVAHDDTALAGENVEGTHCDFVEVEG